MSTISLLATTGDQRIDGILRGLISQYETTLPGRMRGCYVLGSYADGSAVANSDIDLLIVFAGRLEEAERDTCEQLNAQCARLSPVRLDVWARGEADLASDSVLLKLGSLLVYGDDIREQVALPPLRVYTRDMMDAGRHFLQRVLRGADQIVMPLAYPDPRGEFYGYDTVRIPEWYPPETTHGIKELVTSTSRVGRALLALRAGQYVGQKSAVGAMYRAHIGDEWTDYLDALYAYGKMRWQYHVPETPTDRALLRDLCGRTLAFEQQFFGYYRTYLLGLLRSPDAAQRDFALERCGEVVFPDAEVAAALLNVEGSETD